MKILGELALTMGKLDVAQDAFEKVLSYFSYKIYDSYLILLSIWSISVQCLKKNPNHWPAGDGILSILCQREDYNEAYGWALKWYDKNSTYERGLNVILEIREKFAGFGLDYIEKWVHWFEWFGIFFQTQIFHLQLLVNQVQR